MAKTERHRFGIFFAQNLTLNTINYLKLHQPIGCRDLSTFKHLYKNGIKSYFSGCLTTTLDQDYKIFDNQRSNEIYFCDYRFGRFVEADKYIKQLKNYNFDNIKFTTHAFKKQSTHKERFEKAKDLIKKYSKARLVVTSRLHCAIPCLALETPVIFVTSKYDVARFDGLCDLLNVIIKNKDGIKIKVNLDDNGNVINSKDYLKLANNLKSKVRNMLKSA